MKINSAVLLRAAEIACPGKGWIDFGGWIACEGAYDAGPEFNPLTSDADAMALERALKKAEWQFSYERDEFQAAREHSKPIMVGNMPGQEISTELLSDESDTLLLLKCVSAQFSIPLYLERTCRS